MNGIVSPYLAVACNTLMQKLTMARQSHHLLLTWLDGLSPLSVLLAAMPLLPIRLAKSFTRYHRSPEQEKGLTLRLADGSLQVSREQDHRLHALRMLLMAQQLCSLSIWIFIAWNCSQAHAPPSIVSNPCFSNLAQAANILVIESYHQELPWVQDNSF